MDDFNDTGKPLHGFFEFTFRRFFDDHNGPGYNAKISLDANDSQGPVYVWNLKKILYIFWEYVLSRKEKCLLVRLSASISV